jgi:hypothetical protein
LVGRTAASLKCFAPDFPGYALFVIVKMFDPQSADIQGIKSLLV